MFFLDSLLAAVFTANGNGNNHYLSGGTYSLQAFGAGGSGFSAGTFKMQRLLADGTTFLDVATATFTANGQVTVQLPAGTYRMVMSGGGASIQVKAQILAISLN